MPSDDPIVTTASGVVVGTRRGATVLFAGIPYAEAPVGERRFAAPAPMKPWEGVREAREPAPGAIQPWRTDDPWNGYFNPPEQSFDCLTLTVHAPVGAEKAPVLVWIHGGGFISGVGTAPAHRGDSWVRDGIVHVAVNYRTGLDGFMLFDDSIEQGVDNLGLRDQIAALAWVQRNITAFGGDPENVTVMGQSGGAVCVAMLMASPLAVGLFRRAVTQSGAPHGSFSIETARAKTELVARLAGCDPTRTAMRALSEEETRRVLQEVDELAGSDISLDEARLPIAFAVTHGTPSLPRPVLEALGDGAARHVDLLVGATNDEVAGMMARLGLAGPESEVLIPLMTEHLGITDELLGRYRRARGTDSDLVALCGVLSDAFFGIPSLRMAQAHQGACHAYRFTWQSPSLPAGMGADHTFDIPFVQDDFEALLTSTSIGAEMLGVDPPEELAHEMHGAFVRFVKSGDPGWAPFGRAPGIVMRFGDGPQDPSQTLLAEELRSSAI